MSVEMKCTGGRYPGGVGREHRPAHPLDPKTIQAVLSIQDGKVLLRLDDADHPEFWMELEISLEDLNQEYNEAIFALVVEKFNELSDEEKRKILLGE